MIKAVIVALILCVIEIIVVVVASPMAKPSLVLKFLPKDVREVAKDHEKPPLRKQIIAHLLFAGFIIAMIGGIVFLGVDGLRSYCGFCKLTFRFIIIFYVMKAFDVIVQDQWLVMTVGYFKKLFPETAECDGWKDRRFNNKNQLVRIIVYPFLCMILAGIFILFR